MFAQQAKRRKISEVMRAVDENMPASTCRIKNILIVGDGDFSYAVALTQKRRAKKGTTYIIQATELRSAETLRKIYQNFDSNCKTLCQLGVSLVFGIDATKLHQHYEGQHFDEIHFNGPHVAHGAKDYEKTEVQQLVTAFCASAKLCQRVCGKLFIGIPDPADRKHRYLRQSATYNIYPATLSQGYKYKFKRQLPKEYHHKITYADRSTPVAEQMRQFEFCRTPLSPKTLAHQSPSKKFVDSTGKTHHVLFSQETLVDSQNSQKSEYEDLDDDTLIHTNPLSAAQILSQPTSPGLFSTDKAPATSQKNQPTRRSHSCPEITL